MTLQGGIEPWGDDLVLESATPTPATSFAHSTPLSGGMFSVRGIPIAAGAAALPPTSLDVRVGVVGRWRVERLEVPGAGRHGPLRAGPFGVWVDAGADGLHLSAALTDDADLRRDAAAYAERVPLRLGHGWVMQDSLRVRDASGDVVGSEGFLDATGTGGSTTIHVRRHLSSSDGTPAVPIRYPATVELRMPEDVRMEQATFDLSGLAVPSARAP